MKQHLRFLFTLLLAIVCGGAMFGQTTVTQTTFTVTSANNLNGDKNVSYSCEKGGGTAEPNISSNSIQLYQIASGKDYGNTITISIAAGFEIKSVKIGTSKASSVAYTIDDNKDLSTKVSVKADEQYSVKDLSTNSITFYCMGTAKANRFLINYLSVTYSEKGAENTQTKLTFPKDSYSFSTTDDLSSFTGQTPTLKAGESELTGKTITYSKTGDDIFTSFNETTGNLSLNGNAGTAIVTAKFAGDATYAASTASYTIKVDKVYTTIASFKKDIPASANSTAKAVPFSLKLTDAIVTYVNGKKAYLQDATSGVLVYGTNALGLKAGQKFTGNVKVSACLFNGMAEITAWNPASDIIIEENVDIPVVTVTLEQLNGADYDKYECVRVKVEGATITTAYTTAKKATITQGMQTYLIYGEVSGLDVNKGDVCDFVGYPSYNKTSSLDEHRLSIWSQDDITVKFTVAATTISFNSEFDASKTYIFSEGVAPSDYAQPTVTLTPAEAMGKGAIEYTSSNTNVVEVNKETGTLSFEGKTTYNQVATITVQFVSTDGGFANSNKLTYKVKNVEKQKAATTLKFAETSGSVNLGETFVLPELTLTAGEETLTGKTYSYESSAPDVASVDENGNVSVKTAGTTIITATFAGDDDYAESSATYTLKVVDPNMLEATFDFSKPGDYGVTLPSSGGKVMAVGDELKSGEVTLKITSLGSTTNGIKWWNDYTLRTYNNAEFQLKAPDGYLLTSVDIVASQTEYISYYIEGGKKGANWNGSKQVVTVKNDSQKSSRINSITVKYAKLETLTTAASGFATYAADYDVNYSALGLTTYAIAIDEANNKVSYNRFEGVVPAGKAVLVQGTASTPYALTPAEGAADATFSTGLKASDGTVTAADDKIYAFGTLNGKSGFKLVNNGITIPAKKGYLELTGTTAAKPTFFAFDGIGTGISHIEADAALENAAMYNLAGQRVDKSYKGVVIVNGKKMLRK